MIRCWLAYTLLLALIPTVLADETRKIEVTATGTVTIPADELFLSLEVRTSGEEFDLIKQRNDVLLKQVLDLATRHQLLSPPIESTHATFDFTAQRGRQVASPKGQKSQSRDKDGDPFALTSKTPPQSLSRRLTLRFENLEQANEVLTKLTAHEAVHGSRELLLSQLQAKVKDTTPHEAKARRDAVKLAREKAALLAEASGLELGAPIAIVDGSRSTPRLRGLLEDDPFGRYVPPARDDSVPHMFVAFEKQANTNPDDLPPAQVEISAEVRVVYEAQLRK